MAHELDFNAAGEARMFSYNANPWHKLGTVVDTQLTDAEVLNTAKLNWDVLEQPVYDGDQQPVDGYKLLRRSEDGANYAIVSEGYRVFQNSELINLMREISFKTPLVWETAGAMHRGKTVWALARLPELKIKVGAADETYPYMLLSNGHGNRRPLTIMPTAVRVVCANTLSLAQGASITERTRSGNVKQRDFSATAIAQGFAIKHTSGLDAALVDVVAAYKHVIDDVRATQEAYDAFSGVTMSSEALRGYWDSIFGNEPESATARDAYVDRNAELRRIYKSPTCSLEGVGGTLYAAYQAATEFVDHGRMKHKRMASETQAGLAYAMSGSGWDLKVDAFTQAVALV
jgi:phage/plasmid-like protein (TIGR03299 family)